MTFDTSVRLAVIEHNQLGLPVVYNRFIDESFRNHEMVFIHDDVWLDDMFISDRLRTAFQSFDIVGLAGNRRLIAGAPAWAAGSDRMEWDTENLAGIVSGGQTPFGEPKIFGPTPSPVELLDGLLIAARVSALLDAGVRFDERFDFHFYDLDFSRQANLAHLKVGTWPIAVTHASGGAFGSPAWKKGLEIYRNKWGN